MTFHVNAANTSNPTFDQQRPDNISNKKWSSLKSVAQEAKLLPTPVGIGGELSSFGNSVSVDGNRALVGAFNALGHGVVYIFDYDGSDWIETATLLGNDAFRRDEFGYSVSLDGDRALIGARYDDDHGSASGSVYVFELSGGSWGQTAKLTQGNAASSDQFGISVSLDGDRALVGAFNNDDNASNSGSAYVFEFNGGSWGQTAKLNASDGALNDLFGYSVSLSGGQALVGSYQDDDNGSESGSAYIFKLNGGSWGQTAKLIATDAAANDRFGYSVSLFNNRALIGAYQDDDNGNNSGSAYVFKRNAGVWEQTAKLTATDGAAHDQFGYSVSITSDRALIGAHFDDDNGNNSGSAYIFKRNGSSWAQTAKIVSGDGEKDDQFGYSVSLSSNRALVGAHQDDDNGNSSGSAYVFVRIGNNWVLENKLTPNDGASGNHFGYSVSLSAGRALIGANSDNDNGANSGSAYIFKRDGYNWEQTAKLTAPDAGAEDQFGYSVSLSNGYALISAVFNDVNGTDSGSAYIYKLVGNNWAHRATLTPDDGASYAWFGISVSLSGERALIGAFHDVDNEVNSGSAYIFERIGSNWEQTAKLIADDAGDGDEFGLSVSLSANRALIGAYRNADNGMNSGSAYIFELSDSSWQQTAKLTAADTEAYDQFGWAVSISGHNVLIGANRDDDAGYRSGSAYIYKSATFSVGVTVNGLDADNTIELTTNGQSLNFTGPGGPINFTNPINDGTAYAVVISSQPTSPNQTCTITGGNSGNNDGSGTISEADVEITATCVTTKYDINVSVTGLAATNSVSFANGADTLTISSDTTELISNLNDEATFNVSMTTQPETPNQICSFVGSNSGTLSGADVDITVTCITTKYDINVSVTGLAATNSVSFANASDTLTISSDTTELISNLDDETAFSILITVQPESPNQICSFVGSNSGVLAGANTTINIECVADQYTIGGSVTGLSSGNSVTLSINQGSEFLIVSANQNFVFLDAFDDGSDYDVVVFLQPSTPSQTCVINNDSGTLAGENITAIEIECSINSFFVGGSVTGIISDNNMLIQNNSYDLIITHDGAFVFTTPIFDQQSYSVTIDSQPNDPLQTCNIVNANGTISGGDIVNVFINCEFGDDLIYRHGFDSADGVSRDYWQQE